MIPYRKGLCSASPPAENRAARAASTLQNGGWQPLPPVLSRTLVEYDQEDDQDAISQDAIIEYLAYNGLSGAYLYEQLAEAE